MPILTSIQLETNFPFLAKDITSDVNLHMISETEIDKSFPLHSTINEFSIKDFFSKCDQIRSFLRIIWSHLLKKTLMENFIFCKVSKLHIAYLELKQPLHNRPYTM